MNLSDLPPALRFTAAADSPHGDDEAAERQCLSFSDQYLRQARELNEAQRTLTEVLDDADRRFAFVIRNLLDAIENSRSFLAAPAGTASSESGEGDGSSALAENNEPTSAAASSHPSQLGLASVQRSLAYILEELGVKRVDLLGQCYGSVIVDGRTIADPFEVVSSTQDGKASERQVTQVLRDLWVDRDGRVVQKGSVIC